jgi:hypothetical protein
MLRDKLLVACLTFWLGPVALLTPKQMGEKAEHFVNMQEIPPRAMKGLRDSKKIRFLSSKLPLREKEEKYQRRGGKKKQ